MLSSKLLAAACARPPINRPSVPATVTVSAAQFQHERSETQQTYETHFSVFCRPVLHHQLPQLLLLISCCKLACTPHTSHKPPVQLPEVLRVNAAASYQVCLLGCGCKTATPLWIRQCSHLQSLHTDVCLLDQPCYNKLKGACRHRPAVANSVAPSCQAGPLCCLAGPQVKYQWLCVLKEAATCLQLCCLS
jgi:hypothetical protein